MGWDEFDQGIAAPAASLPIGDEIPFGKQIEKLFATSEANLERDITIDQLLALAAETQTRLDAGDDLSGWWMLNEQSVRWLVTKILGLPREATVPEYLVALADALR